MSKEQSTLRPLIPKVSRSPSCQASLQLSNNLDPRLREPPRTSTLKAKRAQVRVACVTCQRQKAKVSLVLETCKISLTLTLEQCDSHRPACARCTRRSVACRYDVEAGVSRYTSIQQRNGVLQTERDLLYRLIVYMSTRSEIEAKEVFGRIRMCSNPFEVAKSLSG